MEAVHWRRANHDKKGDGDPTPIVVPVVLRHLSTKGSGAINGSRISRSTSNFGRTGHRQLGPCARRSALARGAARSLRGSVRVCAAARRTPDSGGARTRESRLAGPPPCAARAGRRGPRRSSRPAGAPRSGTRDGAICRGLPAASRHQGEADGRGRSNRRARGAPRGPRVGAGACASATPHRPPAPKLERLDTRAAAAMLGANQHVSGTNRSPST
jgi:hypothetical protein